MLCCIARELLVSITLDVFNSPVFPKTFIPVRKWFSEQREDWEGQTHTPNGAEKAGFFSESWGSSGLDEEVESGYCTPDESNLKITFNVWLKAVEKPIFWGFKLARFSPFSSRRGEAGRQQKECRDENTEELRFTSVLWVVRQESVGCPQRGLNLSFVWNLNESEIQSRRVLCAYHRVEAVKINHCSLQPAKLPRREGTILLLDFCLITKFTGKNLLPMVR